MDSSWGLGGRSRGRHGNLGRKAACEVAIALVYKI